MSACFHYTWVTGGHTLTLALSTGQATQRGMACPQAQCTELHSNCHPSLSLATALSSFSPGDPLDEAPATPLPQ